MKEKFTVFLTLSAVFSLFLYYKVNPTSYESNTVHNNIIEEDVNLTHSSVDQSNLDFEIVDSSDSNEKCLLTIDETDRFSFNQAFKYYRECVGLEDNFKWNNKYYSTLLIDEVPKENQAKSAITSADKVDKAHLELQNEIIGINSDN